MANDSKFLMEITEPDMDDLHKGPETGLNFYVVTSPTGFLGVLNDGAALPLHWDPQFYCLDDWLRRIEMPELRRRAPQMKLQAFPNRTLAMSALRAANISPIYIGSSGALPLVRAYQLMADTVFYRYCSNKTDPRHSAGNLSGGTYLTSNLDHSYVNTGFAAVGRYSLPLPLPASYVFQYELRKGTTIHVGTVSPNFGQAGGGVEVWIQQPEPVRQVGSAVKDDY